MAAVVKYGAILMTFYLAITLVYAADVVVKDDGTTNVTKGGKSPHTNAKPQPTPLEIGMKPVFTMTKFFLDNILQPNERGPPEVVIQSMVRFVDGNFQFEYLTTQLQENWQSVSLYYLGFAICIVIGLIFIIVMPIVGFCFCCCRLCGNCGGHASQMDPKLARCKQVTYTIFLLLIATLMLAGVICAFVTNDLFHTQISDKERGYVSNVNRSIVTLEKYLDTTAQEFKTEIGKEVNTGIDQLSSALNRSGTIVLDELKVVTDAGPLLESVEMIANDIPQLKLELQSVKVAINDVIPRAKELGDSLNAVKKDIKEGLKDCSTLECINLKDRAEQLGVNVDFSKLPNIQPVLEGLETYLNLQQKTKDAKLKFDKFGTDLTKDIKAQIDNTVRELEKQKVKIDQTLTDLEKDITNVTSGVGEAQKVLNGVPQQGLYNNIAVYVGVGLSCLFLLIVLLLYMGMMFGVCGERPYDDARFCNKGVGANFLLAAVGFMFLFSAFLMLVTMLLFMTGAPLETEVCRHLMDPLESKFIENVDGYFNLGQFLYGGRSKDKLTIREVLTKCENNTALYSALQLNRTFDIGAQVNDVLKTAEPKIQEVVDEVTGQSFKNIQVIPTDLKDELVKLKNDAKVQENFDTAINELNKSLTTDLSAFIDELEMLGVNSAKLATAITSLNNLNRNEIPALKTQVDRLKTNLTSLKRVSSIPSKVNSIETKIAHVQAKLTAGKWEDTITQSAAKGGEKMLLVAKNVATGITDLVENDIGRCRPIYDSYFTLVGATCSDLLNPFNSFWFAYGMCLLFFIPAIIFAVKLAGLYRKTDKYIAGKFETIGSNVYPGDNLPMDDVRKPPPYQARGTPNSAYDGHNGSAPPLEYGQGMLEYEMPYAVPARKGLYPPHHRDNRPLLNEQQM